MDSRHARSEYGASAKRADHFVVAHVNNPQIAITLPAFARNGQNHVRIDGGHGHTDDLKIRCGKTFAQQDLQITPGAKGWIRIAHGCRFAKHKNTIGVGRFYYRHAHWHRRAGQSGWKESVAKAVIGHIIILAADYGF